MITAKQKWILCGLVPLSGAVWAPQIAARFAGGEEKAQVSIDGPTESEMIEMGDGFAGMVAGDQPVTGGQGAQARSRTTPRDPGPESGPQGEGEAGGVTSSVSVEGPDSVALSVLKALQSADAFGGAAQAQRGRQASAVSSSQEQGTEVRDLDEAAEPTANRMVVFVQDNPLRGTLTGANRKVALLGSYRLETGMAVPGTSATVVSIERGRVVLEEAGMTIEIEMPPLRADATRARTQSASGSESADGSGDSGGAAADGGTSSESHSGQGTLSSSPTGEANQFPAGGDL